MYSYKNIKRKALSASEKLEIIKKADAQRHVMGTKVAEELSIPGSTNNIMKNKENMLPQCVPTQPDRKKLKTSKYEKNEPVLLQHFRQKWALNIL
jgi:hypothetical protein